jgi:hypothetical protein
MSDNIMALLTGALEGGQRSLDTILQDQLARRRQQEQQASQMNMLNQRQSMDEASSLRLAEAQGKMNLNNQMKMKQYESTLPVRENPADYVTGSEVISLMPTLKNIDPNKKYRKDLVLPLIQNTNKQEIADNKLSIPGFKLTGEVTPSETEAKNMRDGVSEFSTFMQGLDTYKQLLDKYGTGEVFPTEGSGKLDSISKDLQLKVKNLAQLGVLSISDIPFIMKQIPEPGVMKFKGNMVGALDQTKANTIVKVKNQLKSRGYEPADNFFEKYSNSNTSSDISSQIQSQLPGGAKIKSIKRID